ncbi:acetylxylan esterase [Faecalicatena sp. AGMB00832]|uniref:Acetylxylan esterase n=1 Tax=Faecalicatena faecalis TaxID=2726362 RepID=A0ABS6D7I6_9FIRM|nr:acetylxylan esterase [Faecalicatena faecalis]MBU3877137.1 acetylxylan esterase [Faecalicatena faecalis]
MGVFDLPLNELKVYQGSTPCPDDFDDFWDKSVKEAKGLEWNLQLERSSFQTNFAECFDLYFTGVGGARIHAKYVRPLKCLEPHPAVFFFHGYTGHSGTWVDKLNYAANGYSVFALDVRGQGGLSQDIGGVTGETFTGHITRGVLDGPEKMLFRQVFMDVVELAEIAKAMPEVDENRLGAYGMSQGGALTLICGALVPEVKKIAPLFPYLCDYKRVWEIDLAKNAYDDITYYFRKFDPCHEHEDEFFTKLGYIDVQNFAKRIQADVMFGTALLDTTCPPSSQFAVYNKIRAKKELVVYPEYIHEPIQDFADKTYEFLQTL